MVFKSIEFPKKHYTPNTPPPSYPRDAEFPRKKHGKSTEKAGKGGVGSSAFFIIQHSQFPKQPPPTFTLPLAAAIMSKKNRQSRRQHQAAQPPKPPPTQPAEETAEVPVSWLRQLFAPAPDTVLDGAAYREFIRTEYASQSREVAAIKARYDSSKQVATCITANVKANRVLAALAPLKDLVGAPVCITIKPECQPLLCHQNAQFVEKHHGWPRQIGFNVTACDCGALMCFELHSVNANSDGEYVDFTTDFADEETKWFVPFRAASTVTLIEMMPAPRTYRVGYKKCRCNKAGWNPAMMAPPMPFAAVKAVLQMRVLVL